MVTATPQTANTVAQETRAAIVADRDGIILEWNRAAEAIFGYSAAEALGQNIEIVIPEEERADHWRGFRRVFATNRINYSPDHILDIEGVRRDGTRVPLDAMLQPVHDGSGQIVAITALVCVHAAASAA
jgi:PAS domain S-box-containing protein